MKNRSGSVLMITMWVVAILSIFAIGLGHRASINLKLTSFQRDKLKASYLGRAGVNKAILILRDDLLDLESKDYDAIELCGVGSRVTNLEEFFSLKKDGWGGSFKTGYILAGEFKYGLRDEERCLNINGITGFDNKSLLTELFKLKNIDNPEGLSEVIINYIDADIEEQETFKNQKLVAKEELGAVLGYFYAKDGMEKKEAGLKAQKVFNEVSGLITVYGAGKLNINTVQEEALKVFSRTMAKANTKEEAVADSLTSRIIDSRKGTPFRNQAAIEEFKVDDPKEKELFDLIKPQLIAKSDFFRMEVSSSAGRINKNISAVYDRGNKKIVYWHEN